MKRPLRLLKNSATLLSLLLMLGLIAAWIRSHHIVDWLTYSRITRHSDGYPIRQSAMLRSSLGHIVFAFGPSAEDAINPLGMQNPGGFNWFRRPSYYHYDSNNHVVWNRLGFQIINSRKNWPVGPVAVRGLQVPYWFLTVVFATPTILCLMNRLRRSRRASRHLCPTCGYDLRATPDRCPECGTPAQPPRQVTMPA